MRKVIAASIAIAIFTASSGAALAERKKQTSGVFKNVSCQQSHESCVSRCISAGKAGSQLNMCMQSCAGTYLRCKSRTRD
jgi:hypothetical protein